MSEVTTQFGHEHQFVFLRQEKVPITTWGDRISKWGYYDVFFCEGCLDYQRIKVKETEPHPHLLGEVVTWRRSP